MIVETIVVALIALAAYVALGPGAERIEAARAAQAKRKTCYRFKQANTCWGCVVKTSCRGARGRDLARFRQQLERLQSPKDEADRRTIRRVVAVHQ
jgi:hypothetical protein